MLTFAEIFIMTDDLINKYNVPGPRYTSYPTVPYWDQDLTTDNWLNNVNKAFAESNAELSLYIHLPFCESMCTFCGCTKRITKNHKLEMPYIDGLLKEWRLYCQLLGEKPVIKELHLGGGTPTFFSASNLEHLINGIFANAVKAPDCSLGFEGHPNNTTPIHLQKLYDLGFRRVSFGVQDYAEVVQRAINRIQPYENVKEVTLLAQQMGYTSVAHDLVFGLPFQTTETIQATIHKTLLLRPDRIAFYSYAHVPWIKGNGQRGFNEENLPKNEEKRALYETGKKLLEAHGYVEIGMDHFALPGDPLLIAAANGKLHRNFMGYTENKTKLLLGLGISAISDSWYGFGQNVKSLDDYFQLLEWNALPLAKGHLLTDEDLLIRKHILELCCQLETRWGEGRFYLDELPGILIDLQQMEHDGLVELFPDGMQITPEGRPFVRNVCMAFDLRLKRKRPEAGLFSMTV